MKTENQARRCTALLLAVILLLTSCGGGGANAATMRLMRTEGKAGVTDGAGKSVAPKENLALYSGYGVDTQPASFAWINLDNVKLAKLDEKSEIAIQKEGKHLEIVIKSGSLFFNVAQPLEADETMELSPEPDSEADQAAAALAQYRVIVEQAAAYDYGADDPDGTYRYALARMRIDDNIPALLLEQDTIFGISNVLVFQYEPDSGQAVQSDGTMSEGVAQAGGYRGSLFAAGDGNGILSTEFSSGNGMGSTSRVTLNGNSLQSTTLWEGNIFEDTDSTSEEIGYLEIGWHDVADLSGLDSWTPPAAGPSQTVPDQPEPAGTALPTDGDRIVFRGTLGAYGYSEVLTLQGQSDPNPGSDMGETYYLIVLDEPQTMNLRSGDGLSSRDGEVHLVDVSYAEGIAQYAGQNLAFSIDPDNTWWPSDASLPLGEPRTDDVHVLS